VQLVSGDAMAGAESELEEYRAVSATLTNREMFRRTEETIRGVTQAQRNGAVPEYLVTNRV